MRPGQPRQSTALLARRHDGRVAEAPRGARGTPGPRASGGLDHVTGRAWPPTGAGLSSRREDPQRDLWAMPFLRFPTLGWLAQAVAAIPSAMREPGLRHAHEPHH